MRKYEFVPGDVVTLAVGTTLHRIRALEAIAATAWNTAVAPGDLGGYIEKEENLSHQGTAWVSDDAQVYGNAWVSDDAQVYGDARVCLNALLRKQGDIFWASNVGTEQGTLTVYRNSSDTLTVTRGCFTGTVEGFLAASAQKHDERIRREYQLLIEVAKSRILGEEVVPRG